MEIVVRRDGVETDITEAVQIAYDVVHASMDWGSGFLSTDEMAQIVALADACGFQPPEMPYSYMVNEQQKQDIQEKAKDIRAMFRSIPVVRP